MLIRDMKLGDDVNGMFLATCEVKETRKGKLHTAVTLRDSTGELPTKFWDHLLYDLERRTFCVKIFGKVSQWEGNPQIDTKDFSIVEDGISDSLIRKARRSEDELKEKIKHYIGLIENNDLKRIVFERYKARWQDFFKAPAAKSMHHAYWGGLPEHKVGMLELADFVCTQRPALNKDYMYTAILLHDFEKIDEMHHDLGMVSDYTNMGKLYGHIAMASLMFQKTAVDLGISTDTEHYHAVQHMLLSHHGKLEWGSPVAPSTLEAIALHYIDNLDAKMQSAEDALYSLNVEKEWTKKQYALEGVELYRPKKSKEELQSSEVFGKEGSSDGNGQINGGNS